MKKKEILNDIEATDKAISQLEERNESNKVMLEEITKKEELEHLHEVTDILNSWVQDPILEKYAAEGAINELWSFMQTIDEVTVFLEKEINNK